LAVNQFVLGLNLTCNYDDIVVFVKTGTILVWWDILSGERTEGETGYGGQDWAIKNSDPDGLVENVGLRNNSLAQG
jgi:hypothetical protein